ncbi:signal peptidase II [Gelidibacter salicanalis]|uniref:Lipoprotein signal peptidase n=1 Tax=Gelidibacter salicanalis TaxID=291193 RepID=A0A934NH32_9FLAO|nr:signal peptidase II [Gelidibacter salicanalis]MBJ7880336.1 signal peptidase II [Gelidibacter salicanalis]
MKLSRTISIILLIVANITIDQISKFIVRAKIAQYEVIELIGDTFILTKVENEGAFLGMGSDLSPALKWVLLLILPVIVLGGVVYYILTNKTLDRLSLIAFCCIVGGGIANVFDRFMYGSVTDFFHIDLGGVFRTGIFNVADMSVSFGMILLVIASFQQKKLEKVNA